MVGRAMREFRRASDEFRSTVETNLHINDPDPPPSEPLRPTAIEARRPRRCPPKLEPTVPEPVTAPVARRRSRARRAVLCAAWLATLPSPRVRVGRADPGDGAGLPQARGRRARARATASVPSASPGSRPEASAFRYPPTFLVDLPQHPLSSHPAQHGLSMVATRGPMRELTSRQRDVLDFIRSFTARHGVPPTVREIGERFQVTPRAAFDHLQRSRAQGDAAAPRQRPPDVPGAHAGRARGRATIASVPILGRIAAGGPLLAAENREGELPLAAGALPGGGEESSRSGSGARA